jgi:hypothetical protein
MVTKEQAMREHHFHYTGPSGKHPYGHPCRPVVIGPRGGRKGPFMIEVRASGKCPAMK